MDADRRKLIVISGVNFTEGGPLSVMKDCLRTAQKELGRDYRIIALVHRASLFDIPDVEFLEYPIAKSSWLVRLFYEFVYFRRLSRRLQPYLWLSLHDITPNVESVIRAVYCHNPSPFYRLTLRQAMLEPVFALFNQFYIHLYRINIKKNDFVIVQQDWLRERFKSIFGIGNVVVAHPDVHLDVKPSCPPAVRERYTFMFPAFPRVFKNFEVLGEATRILEHKGIDKIEVILTFSGDETRYARYVAKRCADVRSLKFIGSQPRSKIFELYGQVDALIFPSRLETWGMPLTEFKCYGKPILAADLPYAHETLGDYDKVKFFDPLDPVGLARLMGEAIAGRLQYEHLQSVRPRAPYAEGWGRLFEILLQEPAPS